MVFNWRIKDQLDVTSYFISPLMCSTCFWHLYIHHQELATIQLNYHIGCIVLGSMCVGVSVWLGWSGIRVAGWSLQHRYIYIYSLVFSLEGRAWQEPEPSHVTGIALAHCILGKFLGVVCHCFPPPLDVPTLAARFLRPQRRERS